MPVTFKCRFRKLLISGIRRLLGRPFPRSTRASLFLGPGFFETFQIKVDSDVASCVFHEIERKAEGLENIKSPSPGEDQVERRCISQFFELPKILHEKLVRRGRLRRIQQVFHLAKCAHLRAWDHLSAAD